MAWILPIQYSCLTIVVFLVHKATALHYLCAHSCMLAFLILLAFSVTHFTTIMSIAALMGRERRYYPWTLGGQQSVMIDADPSA